jgi:hypothetical protein
MIGSFLHLFCSKIAKQLRGFLENRQECEGLGKGLVSINAIERYSQV